MCLKKSFQQRESEMKFYSISLSLIVIIFVMKDVFCNQTNEWSRNPFNEKAFIIYRPQTPIIENNGQEKSGSCPNTRSATGFKSFRQVFINFFALKV
jgi:hypothetical protein